MRVPSLYGTAAAVFLALVQTSCTVQETYGMSAPYLVAAKGGGKSGRSALADFEVTSAGATKALSTATTREVNSDITERLEAFCSRQRPDEPAFAAGLERFVNEIQAYCSSRDECWIAPYVKGVHTVNVFTTSGFELSKMASSTKRERLTGNTFLAFDPNEDYRISRQEHLDGFCHMYHAQDPSVCETDNFRNEVMPFFEEADANSNGFVEFDEFRATKSRDYSLLQLPYTRPMVDIPVFPFLLTIYKHGYHYAVRQMILLLSQVLVRIEPISSDMQQNPAAAAPATSWGNSAPGLADQPPRINSPTQLGLIPATFHVMMDSGLDLALVEAILLRGPGSFAYGVVPLDGSDSMLNRGLLRPYLAAEFVWSKVGAALRPETPAGQRALAANLPVGMSFLSMLRLPTNDDATVGIVKVLFMAMDAVNIGAAPSIAEGFRIMSSQASSVRSDQGHAFRVVYQSLHGASPTFRKWEKAVDSAKSTVAVIHRRDAIRMLEECSEYILKKLIPSPSSTKPIGHAANERSVASLSSRSRRNEIFVDSTVAPLWSTAEDAPLPPAELANGLDFAYRLDLAEVIVAAMASGRNFLHDAAIAGQSDLIQAVCQGIENTPPNSPARKAFVIAMQMGDVRLGRTPLHFAANWYSGGEAYQALTQCMTNLGADLQDVLTIQDLMGFTPTDYVTGQHQVDLHDTEVVQRVFNSIVDADAATGTKPSFREKQKTAKPSSYVRIDAEGDFSADDGGWNDLSSGAWKPLPQFEYLHNIPRWHGPENSKPDRQLAAESMGVSFGEGGRYLQPEVFEGLPTLEQMTAVVNSHRPVIFRGALRDLKVNRTVWNRENFLRNYGHCLVTIADIPYRSTFSSMLEGAVVEKSITMDAYIESFGTSEHVQDGVPLYMFSAKFTEQHPELNTESLEVQNFMNLIPGVQELHGGQFFVGPEGTGAPIHFHSSAVNALYYGRKRWVLIPPMQSFYSVKPAATYFRDDVEEGRKTYDMYEFVQEAGDLVYVPDYYGHGTVNLQASIGIAFEFENFNHKLFNTVPESVRRMQATVPGSYRALNFASA
eukprot:INCI15027.3.p1 GENE.INCI15027.3~~INCI15027.3.p1  ORF type:complete len:1058 (-),score=159.19 INCI15027.3:919-4092(-)